MIVSAARRWTPSLGGGGESDRSDFCRDVMVAFCLEHGRRNGLKGAAAAARTCSGRKSSRFRFCDRHVVSNDSPLELKRFGNAEVGKGFVVRAVDNSNVISAICGSSGESSSPKQDTVQYGVPPGK